ncbi:MAG: ferredoxin-thioredoxin reductase catalytic domain-containing protein [bacterium]
MIEDFELKDKAEKLMDKLDREAEAAGYHLNPDREMTLMLCEGLVQNEQRYGYMGCPCRLLEGDPEKDLDIICPCDYRDPDLNDYGTCYCALYVSDAVVKGEKEAEPIPERRPSEEERKAEKEKKPMESKSGIPVWRCRVCGYLCARDEPPEKCPVCKVRKERFEGFEFPAG